MNDFRRYLTINNLNVEELSTIMENYLMNEIMNDICSNLKKGENRIKLKKKLLQCNNDISRSIVLNNYIRTIVNVNITNKQQQYLSSAIYAYMRKSLLRQNGIEKRNKLLLKQDYKCSICNKKIEINNLELDHDLPFIFVGDELSNNNKVLCKECNRKKGIKYNYVIKKFLLK